MLKDGKQLESEQDNLTELNQQAAVFAEKRVPLLKALGVL
jgi:hypothetical protein